MQQRRSDYLALIEQLNQYYSDDELKKEVDNGVQKRIKILKNLGLIEQKEDKFLTKINHEQGKIKINDQIKSLEQLISIGDHI